MMATFFGEIVSLSSRALDDDDDDTDHETNENGDDNENITDNYSRKDRISWRHFGDSHESSRCRVLFLGTDSITCGFLKTYLVQPDHPNIIGGICLNPERGNKINLSESNFVLYKTNDEVFTCLYKKSLSPDNLSYSCEQLMSQFSWEKIRVIILSSQHSSTYYSQQFKNSEMFPLLCCLKSSRFLENVPVPFLNQPNTVSGFPAAALTFCQVHNIPAVLYTLYTEVMEVDSVNMNTLIPVLKMQLLQKKIQIIENPLDEIKKKLKESNYLYSNLYV